MNSLFVILLYSTYQFPMNHCCLIRVLYLQNAALRLEGSLLLIHMNAGLITILLLQNALEDPTVETKFLVQS